MEELVTVEEIKALFRDPERARARYEEVRGRRNGLEGWYREFVGGFEVACQESEEAKVSLEAEWRALGEELEWRKSELMDAWRIQNEAKETYQEMVSKRDVLLQLRERLLEYQDVAKMVELNEREIAHADIPQMMYRIRRIVDAMGGSLSSSVVRHLEEKYQALATEKDNALRRKLSLNEERKTMVIEDVSGIQIEDDGQILQLIEQMKEGRVLETAVKYCAGMGQDVDSDGGAQVIYWSFDEFGSDDLSYEERVIRRLILIFDFLIDALEDLSPRASGLIAEGMQRWIVDDIFDVAFLLRSAEDAPVSPEWGRMERLFRVPWKLISSRLAEICTAASIFENHAKSRVFEFHVSLTELKDTSEMEKKIGMEVRAQTLLHARGSISNFTDRSEEHVLVAPIASAYRAKSERGPLWFPSCLVTKSACAVMEAAKSLVTCASDALKGKASGTASALVSAAKESLEAYRNDIPLEHADEFSASVRLRALYHNDCTMLAHMCATIGATVRGVPPSLVKPFSGAAIKLRSSAAETLSEIINETRVKIEGSLRSVTDNEMFNETGSILGRRRAQQAITRGFNHLRETVVVFAGFLPAGEAQASSLSMMASFLDQLSFAVIELPSISVASCESLATLIGDALNHCESLRDLIFSMGQEEATDTIATYDLSHKRAQILRTILDMRMEDIVNRYKEGAFDDVLTRQQVEMLIVAIFEESDLRRQFLDDLDVKEEEGWNW